MGVAGLVYIVTCASPFGTSLMDEKDLFAYASY